MKYTFGDIVVVDGENLGVVAFGPIEIIHYEGKEDTTQK